MDRTQDLLTAGYRYAFVLTHAHRDAEDLVHDAWLSCQHRWTRPSRAYLYRAIRHRWIDRNRGRHRDGLLTPLDEAPPQSRDPEGVIERVDLERALAQLRPREREIIYLASVERWTAAEVADHINAPRGTVLSIIHRAKAKLVRVLEEKGAADVYPEAR